MPITLVTTPGAVDANSYPSLAEAEAYIETRLHSSTWLAATDEVKKASLVMATRVLDGVMCWTGSAASETQKLAWPRTGMYNRNGVEIGDTIVPDELKEATTELARQLMIADLTATNEAIAAGLTQLTAGPVTLKFKDIFGVLLLPPAALNLLIDSWICADWQNLQDPLTYQEFEFNVF
jgi:hypothetical protein